MGKIREWVYVKETDEKVVPETTTIQSKDVGRIWFVTTCQCLQKHNHWSGEAWGGDWWRR